MNSPNSNKQKYWFCSYSKVNSPNLVKIWGIFISRSGYDQQIGILKQSLRPNCYMYYKKYDFLIEDLWNPYEYSADDMLEYDEVIRDFQRYYYHIYKEYPEF